MDKTHQKLTARETAVSKGVENPRQPVEPVLPGAKPVTPAAAAVPLGEPGTAIVEPIGYTAAPAPTDIKTAMRQVRLTHGYVPRHGGAKIPAGKVIELPVEEARYLQEAGIAVPADAIEA